MRWQHSHWFWRIYLDLKAEGCWELDILWIPADVMRTRPHLPTSWDTWRIVMLKICSRCEDMN